MTSIDKLVIVTVGETGAGKSTAVQFFTNDTVPVSDGEESKTMEITLYPDSSNNSWLWMDSKGTSDTNNNETDFQIMQKTLKKLISKNHENAKILWFITKTPRSTSVLQEQASYINLLKPKKIWQSVVIIVREGVWINDVKCAVGAATRNGYKIPENDSNNNIVNNFNFGHFKWGKNAFGLTLIDKLPEVHPLLGVIRTLQTQQKLDLGYMTNNQAKDKILSLLSNVSVCKIVAKNQMCVKCGQKNDSRLFDINCHSTKEWYHPQQFGHYRSTKQYHSDSKNWRHTGTLKTTYHHASSETTGSWNRAYWVHSGRLTDILVKHHPDWSLPSFWDPFYKNRTYVGWTCCNAPRKQKNGLTTKGCEFHPRKWVSGRIRCSSCKKSMSSQGCKYNSVYSCCGKNDSGCVSYHVCSSSCQTRWMCCNVKVGNTSGCAYLCCQRTGTGCQQRCNNCRGAWGQKPTRPCKQGRQYHQVVNL